MRGMIAKGNDLYRVSAPALLAALALCALAAAGCRSGREFSLDAFVKGLLPASPGEVMQKSVVAPEPDERRRALYQMSRWRDADVELVSLVGMALLGEPDAMTRAQAARTLGAWGHPNGATYLAVALAGEAPEVAGGEQDAGPPPALPKVPDGSKFVRIECAAALGEHHGAEALQALGRALRSDADGDVRIASARALRYHQDTSAVRGLMGALADEDVAVRATAVESLSYLTGRDFGSDADAWAQFFAESAAPFAECGQGPEPERSSASWLHFSEDRKAKVREIFSDLFPLERKKGPFD
jgi:hypothetical protein